MIGAWCFLDHYGPDDIKATGGMWVPPHPHTGLQTVTWLFEGLGLHTDSLGSHQLIRPGQLNVMTAGHGICHAEVSPEEAPTRLHGVQLWVCLPDEVRDTAPPDFMHLAELPTYDEPGARVRVLTGSLGGETSTAPTYTPLVGAEVTLRAGREDGAAARARVRARRARRAGRSAGRRGAGGAQRDELPRPGRDRLEVRRRRGDEETVVMLLGGEPFEEEIVMWWNFIGRSHDELVAQREAWNGSGLAHRPERFGTVEDFDGDRLLAPPMPNVRLRPAAGPAEVSSDDGGDSR